MLKITDIMEACILSEALECLLRKIETNADLHKDKKLYSDTWLAANSLRIKYRKIVLANKMREGENGRFEFKDAN